LLFIVSLVIDLIGVAWNALVCAITQTATIKTAFIVTGLLVTGDNVARQQFE
jgi:hypothetical protein